MKQYLQKLTLFFSILLIAMLIINWVAQPKPIDLSSNYLAAIIDKHRRADNIKTPKLILAGGSNLAFGINSELLQQQLGIPVANMGVHAGLGLSFILEDVKATMHEDDIVLLSVEYFLKNGGQYKLKKTAASCYTKADDYFSHNVYLDFIQYLDNTRSRMENLISGSRMEKKKTEFVYSREVFNEYGDVTGHFDKTPPGNLLDKEVLEYSYWDGIKTLNEFYEYARQRKVQVFYLFPPYPISEYAVNGQVISRLAADLKKDLRIEVANTPGDFLYPDSLFFDTVYHLNKEGRDQRTRKLLELIDKSPRLAKGLYTMKNRNELTLK